METVFRDRNITAVTLPFKRLHIFRFAHLGWIITSLKAREHRYLVVTAFDPNRALVRIRAGPKLNINYIMIDIGDATAVVNRLYSRRDT